jgi:RNA polymerase sigma-70 factor (ECF subfamily)
LRLIEAEIPRLRRFACYLARDGVFADDLVQECLLRAIRRIDTWEPGTNLRAWLLTILHNVFLTEKRRIRRRPIISENDSIPDQLMSHAPNYREEEEHRVRSIHLAAVQRSFDRLCIEHREVLGLVAVEEMTYEEAAAVLGVPIGTIRSRLSRARAALREMMPG